MAKAAKKPVSKIRRVDPKHIFRDGIELLTVADFAKTKKVEPQAIYYGIKNGAVEILELGRQRFVVMTEVTRQYTPNDNAKRKPVPKKPKKTKAIT